MEYKMSCKRHYRRNRHIKLAEDITWRFCQEKEETQIVYCVIRDRNHSEKTTNEGQRGRAHKLQRPWEKIIQTLVLAKE